MKQERGLAITRLTLVVLAIAVLLWSGVEDQDVVTVTALGGALSLTVVAWFLAKRGHSIQRSGFSSVLSAVIVGALTGALSSLSTVALMLFKDIRHGHVFPDYPPATMLSTLERLPAWTIAGALVGFGSALLVDLFMSFRRGKRQR